MQEQGARQEATGSGGITALLADAAVSLSLVPMPMIGREPAREMRAYRWGDNPTTKGVFKLTPAGAEKIMSAYRSRNVVRCFDYVHATYDPSARPEDKKAAGQYRKELRAKTSEDPSLDRGGLWYVDIQWTPKAAQGIRDGEWPYISSAPVHDKEGVIVDDRNAALVTDPAMYGAASTLLSGLVAGTSKDTQMADKKRLYLDAFSAAQVAMKRAQCLADTDGMDKELGNKVVAGMAPLMDLLAAHGSTNGYMGDVMLSAAQSDAGAALLSDLAAECEEADLTKLGGAVMARLDGKVQPTPAPAIKGVLLSDTDAASLVKQLLDANAAKVPAARRAQLEAKGLQAVTSYLASATNITPDGPAPREAEPIAPTTDNVEKIVPEKNAGNKPPTYSELSAAQRAKVDLYVETERTLMRGQQFNETTARESGMALLSDYVAPDGPVTRYMPPGGAVPAAGAGGRS